MRQGSAIGVAIGDPSGIGPEVALKAIAALRSQRPDLRFIVAGSSAIVKYTIERYRLPLAIEAVIRANGMPHPRDQVTVLDVPSLSPSDFAPGEPNPICARAGSAYVKELVSLALAGRIDAVACAPISKQALLMTSGKYVGHAELIAHICGSKNYGMFCMADGFATMAVTGHMPLADVPSRITPQSIRRKFQLAAETYEAIHSRRARIAVCSLDPHCGEGGCLGRADLDIVEPVVREAQRQGYTVEGPLAADAIFRPYIRQRYDLVLGMYHDQIKIGIAALDSDRFVAYLAGVRIVRTTTTHGVAFDIAGRGVADPRNMCHTILTAAALARHLNAFRSTDDRSDDTRALVETTT